VEVDDTHSYSFSREISTPAFSLTALMGWRNKPMSDHQANQTTVNVCCSVCGQRYVTEGDAVQESRDHGWRQTETTHRTFCPYCQCQRHPIGVPYYINDDRVLVLNRGWFMDLMNENGTVTTWRMLYGPPPTWEIHSIGEHFV
jgi:hypothetical protein